MTTKTNIVLESGLDLREVLTTGSILHINEDTVEDDFRAEYENRPEKCIDFIGKPVTSFKELEKQLSPVDATGFVKKKILEQGGGLPLHNGCTVSVAYSGYWENEPEPFDTKRLDRPLVVDLNDSGLLPGLHMAVESMLVGETSIFLLSYQVMYGELGIPPRIKKKSDCIFYIKLVKSILTPEKGQLDLSQPNVFERLYHEVKLLYASGITLYKSKNFTAAIQLFRKAVYMLHRCRLADEAEEEKQEKMLKKLYINLAICYNACKQPLKACIACNELNRLENLWNNGKALFQNAKALRMIGQFDAAEKKLNRATKLNPDRKELNEEYELLQRLRTSCNQSKLVMNNPTLEASDVFKREVDNLIVNFKENMDLCKLTLPGTLCDAEVEYIKEACGRENLFFKKIQKDYALDRDEGQDEEAPANLYDATTSNESVYGSSLFEFAD